MEVVEQPPVRAESREEIAPLVALCKAGRLYDVQQWIADGKPINMPPPPKGTKPMSPLEYAIDRGFHTLVQVLLEGGAIQEPAGYGSPMAKALEARRGDIAQLLVEHGFDASAIEMEQVFGSWDPQIMEFFIDRGADIHSGNPFAWALCNRIRTALGVYKKYRAGDESLQEQADIALRHHCYEGNIKWVSLLLWAGADPCTRRMSSPDERLYEDEMLPTALELAAEGNQFDIFDLKPVRSRLTGITATRILGRLASQKGVPTLERLLEEGVDPNEPETGKCPAFESCFERLEWYASGYSAWRYEHRPRPAKTDNDSTRQIMKAIHLLAQHGGKWRPADKTVIQAARKSLLRVTADYVVEFVWIMRRYNGCERDSIIELLRTPSIKAHTRDHRRRINELFEQWPV